MSAQSYLICKVFTKDNTTKNLKFKVQSIASCKRLLEEILKRNKQIVNVYYRTELSNGKWRELRFNGHWYAATGMLMPYLKEFNKAWNER